MVVAVCRGSDKAGSVGLKSAAGSPRARRRCRFSTRYLRDTQMRSLCPLNPLLTGKADLTSPDWGNKRRARPAGSDYSGVGRQPSVTLVLLLSGIFH